MAVKTRDRRERGEERRESERGREREREREGVRETKEWEVEVALPTVGCGPHPFDHNRTATDH